MFARQIGLYSKKEEPIAVFYVIGFTLIPWQLYLRSFP